MTLSLGVRVADACGAKRATLKVKAISKSSYNTAVDLLKHIKKGHSVEVDDCEEHIQLPHQ